MHVEDTVSISISVDTSQFEEYMQRIADPERLKKISRKALRKGAAIVRDAVVARAPERPDGISTTALPIGALKNDIVIRSYTADDGSEHASVRAGEYTDHVASWVEYGHRMITGPSGISEKGYYSKHNRETGKVKGPGTEVGDVPAHPFFRPAGEESADAAADAVCESIAKDIADTEATGDIKAEAA